MVKSLQSIRFIFALMIFLHHSAFPLVSFGAFPVSFFLILSGFVLMRGYDERIGTSLIWWPFFNKRMKKIYPVHILCLLLSIVVLYIIGKSVDWVSLIPNVFLVHAWIPNGRFYFSGNSVSWYLSVMAFCYAMFPFLAKWIKRGRRKSVFVILIIYALAVLFVPDNYVKKVVYINPLFRIFDFCLGVWLYSVCTDGSISKMSSKLMSWNGLRKTILELAIILLSLILVVFSDTIDKKLSFASLWWLPSLLIIYVFYVFDNDGGLFTKILNNRVLVSLGSISFVFYMLHIQILTINNYLMDSVISMNYYINGVLVLLVTTGLSYLITYYYMPLFTRSNKIIRK